MSTTDSPVSVERFARVFVKGPSELPSDADTYFDGERGYYYKLHLDSVTADSATPLIRKAKERFDVELVRRVVKDGMFKERVYVDSPEDVPEGYKVHTGPAGGIYYETGVQSVSTPDTGSQRNVAVITWDDVEIGDEIVFETPKGEETFAEIYEIEERGDEADHLYVRVNGDHYEAVPGTYSVDKGMQVAKATDDPWVPYEGPQGGQGWMNRQTGEVRYQDQHPARAEEQAEPEGPDFDPVDPPEDGYARGWTEPPPQEYVVEGQTVEFWDGESYGYGDVVEATEDSVVVESQGGETVEVEQVTAVEEDWDPTDVPDIEWQDSVEPQQFADAVRQKIEEDPEMGAFLTEHDAEEFAEYDLVLTPEGTAGAAVSPDGDIQNVFALDNAESGAGRAALAQAIEAGGVTLDAYDGYLRDMYAEFGFRETGRMEFNPDYAPEGFNFDKYGHPDVVFMHMAPEEPLELSEDYYEPAQWGDAKEESRREADTSAYGPEEGPGVGQGERGDDIGTGEADRGPIEASSFSSARYSPDTSDDEDDEWPHEQFEKEAGTWTYYYGPQGGEGWLNMATGEIRYQQHRPGDEPEGGDGHGDWLHDDWMEPPDDLSELQVGQPVEVFDGENYEQVDIAGFDDNGDPIFSPAQEDDVEITAVAEFDRHDVYFDDKDFGPDEYFDVVTEPPDEATELASSLEIGEEYPIELPTGVVEVPFSGYAPPDHPTLEAGGMVIHYDDLEEAVGQEEMEDRWGKPGDASPFISAPPGALEDFLVEDYDPEEPEFTAYWEEMDEVVTVDVDEYGYFEVQDGMYEGASLDSDELHDIEPENEAAEEYLDELGPSEPPDTFMEVEETDLGLLEPGDEIWYDSSVLDGWVQSEVTTVEADAVQTEAGHHVFPEDMDVRAHESTFTGVTDGSEEEEVEGEGDTPSEDEASSAVAETPQQDSEFEGGYSPDSVVDERPLSDIGANHGNSMSAKNVHTMPDGSDWVHTDLDHDDIEYEDGERQMVGYEYMDRIAEDITVDHDVDFDMGYFANEVAPGVDAKDAKSAGYAEEVDTADFHEMAAVQVIIGNADAHQNNVRVDENGNLYPFDLDRSGGDVMGPWVGTFSHYDNTLDRIFGELEKTASSLDLQLDREEVMERASEIASGIDQEVRDEAYEAASEYNSDLASTVDSNIDRLMTGDAMAQL